MSGCGICGTHNGCNCPHPNQGFMEAIRKQIPRVPDPFSLFPTQQQIVAEHKKQKEQGPPTAKQIMEERSVEDYMSWAIQQAGDQGPKRMSRWSYVSDIFGTGSGVAYALCEKYGHDPDEIVGLEWTDECPTCGTEFEP